MNINVDKNSKKFDEIKKDEQKNRILQEFKSKFFKTNFSSIE